MMKREKHFCFLFRISYISKSYRRALFIIWFGNNFAFQHSLHMWRGIEACRKRRWKILLLLFIDFVQLSIKASCNKRSSLRRMHKSSRATLGTQRLKQKKAQGYCLQEEYFPVCTNLLAHMHSVEEVSSPIESQILPVRWQAARQPVGVASGPQQWKNL